MASKAEKITITGDKISVSILEKYININGLDDICTLDTSTTKNEDLTLKCANQKQDYPAPIRLGQILDQILLHRKKQSQKPEILEFRDGKLQTHLGVFTNNDGEAVPLTEKEIEILAYLHAHNGQITSRETLLKSVWNYADSVETHTVETHIYRLRQKIEQDPANPKILITQDDGYKVITK